MHGFLRLGVEAEGFGVLEGSCTGPQGLSPAGGLTAEAQAAAIDDAVASGDAGVIMGMLDALGSVPIAGDSEVDFLRLRLGRPTRKCLQQNGAFRIHRVTDLSVSIEPCEKEKRDFFLTIPWPTYVQKKEDTPFCCRHFRFHRAYVKKGVSF